MTKTDRSLCRIPYLRLNGPWRRTLVLGDVHGVWAAMQKWLSAVVFDERDLLILTGDMIDRGPDSAAVARFVRDTVNVFSVLGNHERRVAGVVRQTALPAWSQDHTLSQWPREEWEEWAKFFEGLPAVIETPHAVIAHYRLDPQRSLENQDPYHVCGVGGRMVHVETDPEDVPLLFHQMRGMLPDKPVCIGHQPHLQVDLDINGRLFALDTDAVRGGRLTGVVLPEKRIVSLPVDKNHYAWIKGTWKQSVRKRATPLALSTMGTKNRAIP